MSDDLTERVERAIHDTMGVGPLFAYGDPAMTIKEYKGYLNKAAKAAIAEVQRPEPPNGK